MRRFHAVIFDMDGLLLDSERIALEAFQDTCAYFRIGDQTELFKRCIGINQTAGQRVLKEGLHGLCDYIAFNDVWNGKYKLHTKKPIPLKKGVCDFLKYLAKYNIPSAVATSTAHLKAAEKLKKVRIFEIFDAVIGGDQVAKSKPHPDIYLKAADALGVNANDCLALEDSENGVRSAVNAGMTVVQIPDLIQPSNDLLKLGHIVLNSLHEVMHFDFR